MKISTILGLATPGVLLFIHRKGEVRYSELSKIVPSRGTLSISLKELEEEGLLSRRVVLSKPIKSYYSLTERGNEVADSLEEAARTLGRA